MTAPVHFVVPGPLEQRTGGYIYDRRIVEGLRALGWAVQVHELAGRFPQADATARAAGAAAMVKISPGALPVIDGLALPAFAEMADRLPRPWIALVHHPLALETGLSPAEARAFADLEGLLLARAARVIVTSPGTRRDLAAYDVESARIGVVCPGTDPAPLARGGPGPGLALLCVASLTPRKGHLVLLDALSQLTDLEWHLTCVGSAERDPACAQSIVAAVDRLHLHERVMLVGERAEADVAPFYDRADLFVLASYHEGYGMVLAEALARGLPVVSTTAGAIPETVPADAGLLVPPGDARALAAALRHVMTEPGLHARLMAGARDARRSLPSWSDAAHAFAAELAGVTGKWAVSGFDTTWLTLREPYDHAARSAELAERFAAAIGQAPHLLDLASGTASNLRYLSPHIPGAQRWLCVEHDPALLDAARTSLLDWGAGQGWSRCRAGDGLTLARPGGDILIRFAARDLARGDLPSKGVSGISASALLDLTSASWLDEFAARCRGVPLLMALSFDGRLLFEPAAPEDDEICRRFIAHQRTDKGFGPALGPDAAAHLAERLAAAGCSVRLEAADWRLGPDAAALLRATLAGIVAAAREIAHDAFLEHWATLRGQQLRAGELRLTVGHIDLLALPG